MIAAVSTPLSESQSKNGSTSCSSASPTDTLSPHSHERSASSWQKGFLDLLPTIERYANFALRRLSGEALEDAVAEVIANCMCAYRKLHQKGRLHVAFAGALVRFAVAQFHDGRRVGSRQNSHDVYNPQARRAGGYGLHSLDAAQRSGSAWAETLVENRRSPVPEQVCFRMDFPAWLDQQGQRNRTIAERLSLGHSTSDVASEFNVSRARISQLRRELAGSWEAFNADLQTDSEECEEPCVAVA